MMCMTCNANYKSFFNQFENGTKQVVMNKKVCNNLMKDCFPYLNATNYQGRNMLDMKRMRKFKKEKAAIQEKLEKLQEKIKSSENDDEIVAALEEYETKLKGSMKLTKEDFTGEAADDFKYGFKMPLKCMNDTNCDWICKNMIQADGIADDAVESDQNIKVDELDQDDDQSFETDLVILDEDEETDSTDEEKPPVTDARRMLDATESVGLVYSDDGGYEADSEEWQSDNLVTDDPAMAETIVVPED